MSAFLTPLRVEETDEFGGLWTLLAPLSYRSDLLGRVITVPVGFVTDFASVPRILGVYDLEGGKCNKAAVVHDWLYSMGSIAGGVDRKAADQVLREAIGASGYGEFTASMFYAAVRVAGASHWDKDNLAQPGAVTANMQALAATMKAGA
jgi:hypothetical protein